MLSCCLVVLVLILGLFSLIGKKDPNDPSPSSPSSGSSTETFPATHPLSPEETAYADAEMLLSAGNTAQAAIAFGKLANYADARERSLALWDEIAVRHTICATMHHSFAILESGEIVYGGRQYLDTEGPDCYMRVTEAADWTDIIALDGDSTHLWGLHIDGTVRFLCDDETPCPPPDGWHDIVMISAGHNTCYGLRLDGTVVNYPESGFTTQVKALRNIVSIDAGANYLLARKADGSVVCLGEISPEGYDLSGWTDITAICSGDFYAAGLRSDGTVVCTDPRYTPYTDTWTNIVALFPGEPGPVGLRSDGTLVRATTDPGKLDEWSNIVDVFYESQFYLGLRADGTLVWDGFSVCGESEITAYDHIKLP